MPASQIVTVRDEAHAQRLLHEAGVSAIDERELQRLAQRLVDGRLVLVREQAPVELDEVAEVARSVPMLAELAG